MTPSAVKVYLTRNIDYSLDEENLQGLKLFYKLAHEVGITPAEKELSLCVSRLMPETPCTFRSSSGLRTGKRTTYEH